MDTVSSNEGQETVAVRVRRFFRELLGSRLVLQLEADLANLRNDYERRLQERDDVIADLKSQLTNTRVKLDTYESIIIPLTSPVGNLFKPKPERTFEPISEPAPGSWAAIQRDWDMQQAAEAEREKNATSEIREEVQ